MFRIVSCFIILQILTSFQLQSLQIDRHVIIVGGGVIGLLEAYQSWMAAVENEETVKITVLEKNRKLSATTACNIVPSLTPDEILSVVPRGEDLIDFLGLKFNEGSGIRVDDVEGIDESSETVRHFIESVVEYGRNEGAHKERTQVLLELGKVSMELWQDFYDSADDTLKKLLTDANYNPCLEILKNDNRLHQGYRIDLLFHDSCAGSKALQMMESYQKLGYASCRLLTPGEVVDIDPQLRSFVREYACFDGEGESRWSENSAALWRPGGCLNTGEFIPKFVRYLTELMTVDQNEGSETCLFEIKFDHEVIGASFDHSSSITQLRVRNRAGNEYSFPDKEPDIPCDYILAPGEGVGTLKTLGFQEPDYAVFAGPSLLLWVDLPKDKIKHYQQLDQCMEVHQEGVVLAWQAKFRPSKVFIGVGGTKAFYGDKKPQINEEFAKDRNLLQLNAVNQVYWDLLSIALGKDTYHQALTQDDLDSLLIRGAAKTWVGSRGVAYDGFPTLGALYRGEERVNNARVTTHLGSGGVSFALGCIAISRASLNDVKTIDPLVEKVLDFSDSRR